MKKAYNKDIWRSIKGNKKRFFSIMLITALGVTMLCGLRAACQDLRYTADKFYDELNLFDIQIVSTLGLDDEDVAAFESFEGIEAAEGAYSEAVEITVDEQRKSVELKALSQNGINIPYILEGDLPQKSNEVAVTQKYISESGKKIGDTIIIDESKNLIATEFLITGVVIDATDVNGTSGAVAFRSSSTNEYTFFVLPEAIDSDIYTGIYLTLSDTRQYMCYSKTYENHIKSMINNIDTQLKPEREQARYNKLVAEANEEIADAQAEIDEEFAKADKEIADAREEIADGKKELSDGEKEIQKAKEEIEASKKELADGEAKLKKAEKEISDGEKELEASRAQLEAMENELLAGRQQLELLKLQPEMAAGIDLTAMEQQLMLGEMQLEAGKAQLEEGRRKIEEGKQEIKKNKSIIADGWEQLKAGEDEIAKAEAELEEVKKELEDGESELAENEQKLEDERKKADKEIADAKAELADLEPAQWYIQDRKTLDGYTNVETDAACIEAVGTVFPIIFLAVAILISLTTITRIVEEERGLIGTYKALGFTDKEIRKKYIVYAFCACILGGILGDICGFIVLPMIIFIIFQILYQLPEYYYIFDNFYGIGGIVLFAVGIVGATWIACEAELKYMPAKLMRPKTPRKGSRVFLERITPVWSRMSFLNKVTARNLFRYKKRMFMTIGGIMGCTALVLCGFVIKDSVTELMPSQYEKTYRYDVMAVVADDDNEMLLEKLDSKSEISEYINLRIDSVKVKNEFNEEMSVQLIVIPEGMSVDKYINISNADDKAVVPDNSGVYITQNAANILEFDKGSKVFLQNMELVQKEVVVSDLVRNYMGNVVYMTQNVYEQLYGEYKNNGVLINFSDTCEDKIAFADKLGEEDEIMSIVSVAKLKDEFSVAFYLINMVVYIIIILAAGLALVVLFTLSTTNISERERELATIKVLGFYDNEVHLYVNKETLILTGIGVLLGLPLGSLLGGCLTNALNMPSIYFAVTTYNISYVYAAVISFGFALMVNFMTNKTLDHINPVEALKSIE